MIRAAFTLATALLAAPAHAGPDRVSVLLGSHHIGAAVPFESVNPGIFLTWEDRAGGLDWSVGAYRNSYGRASIAATAALPVIDWTGGELALFGGLALYPGDGRHFAVHAGDVVPIGGIQLRQGNLFLQLLPGDGTATKAVIAGGITWGLK